MLCARCQAPLPPSRSKCPLCGMWNFGDEGLKADALMSLSDVKASDVQRYETGICDPIFGKDAATGKCGIPTISVTLLGGSPGAGKSRVSLQIADALANITQRDTLLLPNEMSGPEIKLYADAMGLKFTDRIRIPSTFAGASAILGVGFLDLVKKLNPGCVILDSLSKATTDERERVHICNELKRASVLVKAPVIIIDHITKEGDFAGVMTLQHDVDNVVTLIRLDDQFRELCTWKNRFMNGPTPYRYYMRTCDAGLVHDAQYQALMDQKSA